MKNLLLYISGIIVFLILPNPALGSSAFELDQNNFLLQLPTNRQLTENLIVKNLSSEKLSVKLTWESPDNISPVHAIDFAKIQNPELQIEPYGIGSTEIDFIRPENLKAGDYYGQVKLAGASQTQTASFTLRLLGQLKESIRIDEVNYSKNQVNIMLQNSGNITTVVAGKLEVTNIFNQKVLDKNIDQFKVKASESIENSFRISSILPGPYQVKIAYEFGDKKTLVTKLQTFWVFNYLLLIPLVFVVTSVLLASRLAIRKKNVQKTA